VSVRTRRRALRAILLNLALNAIKFTERGSVTIRAIEKPCADGQTPAVHFEVIDTGTGIQAALLKQAFEPWEQLSTSSTRRYRGLGLGLAIVRRNVIQLGGGLKVESIPEQGSRFLVVIPKQPAHRKPARRAQPIFNTTSGPDAPAGTRDVAPRAHPTSARD
jgi:signal transduction histidine kinase